MADDLLQSAIVTRTLARRGRRNHWRTALCAAPSFCASSSFQSCPSIVVDRSDFDSVTSPVKRLVKIEQRDGWRKLVSEKAIYVCKDANGKLSAFSSICPHLGCSVSWHDEENNFVCPCHNGQFTADGKLMGGPPPRGLDLLECKVEDGKLIVHYQYFRQLVPNKEVIA